MPGGPGVTSIRVHLTWGERHNVSDSIGIAAVAGSREQPKPRHRITVVGLAPSVNIWGKVRSLP
jgi:hypothetical protein